MIPLEYATWMGLFKPLMDTGDNTLMKFDIHGKTEDNIFLFSAIDDAHIWTVLRDETIVPGLKRRSNVLHHIVTKIPVSPALFDNLVVYDEERHRIVDGEYVVEVEDDSN